MKRGSVFSRALTTLIYLICLPIPAAIEDYYPQSTLNSPSNFGETGLMELPNGKFMEEASLRLNFTTSFPNEYTGLTGTPFSWLEATYRYAEIKNKLYGPAAYSGNQSWKDKNTGEKKEKTEWHRVVVFNEGLVNVVQQYLKKGAQVYVEGQLTTRKWKDEQSGQDKFSTEIVIQGYNSSLTMLGGGNSGGGIQNDTTQQNNIEDSSQVSDMDDEIPF